MKQLSALLLAAAIAVPIATSAASPAPNAKEMAPLQYLVGTWHCEWTTGDASGSEDQVLTSVMNGAWLQEAEVVHDAQGNSFVHSIHFTGYDPQKKKFVHVGPDADGTFVTAESDDSNAWHELAPATGSTFYHTKISDTERHESETFEDGNGKTVHYRMVCKKGVSVTSAASHQSVWRYFRRS